MNPAALIFVNLQKNLAMATDIKCPSCGHMFPMEAAVSEDYKRELRQQLMSYKKRQRKRAPKA
jgi:hypothetical protein